ncbi:MAG: class I SAM-dependent methyltransferase [Candidatus Sericytochromatia bacterium]
MNKLQLLHHLGWQDAFDGFVPQAAPPSWTWHFDHIFLEKIYAQCPQPRLIAEVGTWLGHSAIQAAKYYATRRVREFTLICVDTWLGSTEHWLRPQMRKDLDRIQGYPMIYQHFLSNVQLSGLSDYILPLPQTSANAARILAHHALLFDWVYLDASHDAQDVQLDLQLYWPLVRPGGFLMGDDWNWPSVRSTVLDFCDERRLTPLTSKHSWAVARPLSP